MDFVDEDNFPFALAELIFGIDENQPLFGGHLGAALEEGAGVALHLFVVLLAYQALGDDFLAGDVLVMPFGGLGGRGDDRLGETLVLAHPLGELHSAELAASRGIFAPGGAGKVAADNHFDGETLAAVPYGRHGVGSGETPVRNDVGRGLQEVACELVEHLSLVGDTFGEDYVEGRDAVCRYHHEDVVVNGVDVADFPVVYGGLAGEGVVGFGESFHCRKYVGVDNELAFFRGELSGGLFRGFFRLGLEGFALLLVALVGFDDALDELVAHDVLLAELHAPDALDVAEHPQGLDEA